jgi:hypothetical protein
MMHDYLFKAKISELHLGDTVKLFDGPFGFGVVTKISGGVVKVFRPYATTADFSYTGGVIPYIGTEEVAYLMEGTFQLEVHCRKPLA